MSENVEVLNKIAQMSADIVMTKSGDRIAEAVIGKIKEDRAIVKAIHGENVKDASEEKQFAAEQFQKLARNEVKSLTVGGSNSGAETVPTAVSNDFITSADKAGLVRKLAQKWQTKNVKENVPTLSSVTAYRVNEGAKITSSQPTTGAVSLSAKTVGVIVPVSKKLLLGATPGLVTALTTLMGKAMARLEDKWAILGLASGEGIFQHASVPVLTLGSGDTTYAKAEAEDFLDLIDKADAETIGESTRFLFSLSVLNVLRKLRAAVGSDKQNFLMGAPGVGTPATLWDIPYEISPVMPKTADGSQTGTKFAAIANFDNIIYGDMGAYEFTILDQATITDTDGSTLINLAEQNMVALKMSAEIDIALADPAKAFASMKTAAS